MTTNFFVGWTDGLTGGLYTYMLPQYTRFVQKDSNSYFAGQMVAVVHGTLLGAAAGPCAGARWAVLAAKGINAVQTVGGLVDLGQKLHDGTAQWYDYLNLLPLGGAILGRLGAIGRWECFVYETPVAVGWNEPPLYAAAEETASAPTEVWLVIGAVVIGTSVGVSRRLKKRNEEDETPVVSKEDCVIDVPGRNRHVIPLLSPEHRPLPAVSAKIFDLPSEKPAVTLPETEPLLKPKRKSKMSQFATSAVLLAGLVLGGLCFWQSGLTALTHSEQTANAALTTARPAERTLKTVPIGELRPGMRVLAKNPENAERLPDAEIDPQSWRLVSLHMTKPNGSGLEIQLLRPIDWLIVEAWMMLERHHDSAALQSRPLIAPVGEVGLHDLLLGREIELDLPELGAQGAATLIAISPCPALEELSHDQRMITGTFHHLSANVVDLEVEGQAEPLGVTDNHPFWSADRNCFVPVAQLRIGERLKRADGTLTQVTRITPRRGPPVDVYNLEVDAEHVYHVGADGVLVHNVYHGNSLLSTKAQHGYVIWDTVTGQLLKFGVSGGRITKSGESYRALAQVRKLRAQGRSVDSIIIDRFANRADVIAWERDAVLAIRNMFGNNALPLNLRP